MYGININILNKIRKLNYEYMVKYAYARLFSEIRSSSDIQSFIS